ncbi:MAG: OmpH family outer membrane protein [Deltaproteobacteria bacterium]|nr:OmpH family outer membrane protein [Deltaproteobacteria bacterium]
MRKCKLGLLTIGISIFLLTSGALAADVAKIGLVDFQKILATSDAGKAAQEKISQKGKEMENDLKNKGSDIEEVKKRFEREAMVMSKEARAEKERELKIKILDFKDLEKKYKSEFNAFNMKLVEKFRGDVLTVTEIIGKKEGFLLILEKREGGVLYAPSTIDITDKIILQYNAQYAKRDMS